MAAWAADSPQDQGTPHKGTLGDLLKLSLLFAFSYTTVFLPFLFSPVPRNGGLGTASHIGARHRQSPFDSILPSVRPSPPFLVWCQSGREFSKPSNQEYLTHPKSPERKTLNPKKWFQETWGPEHVGECRSGLHPLSSLDSPWTYEVLGWWDKPHFRQPASALSLSLALIFSPLCPCSILKLTFYSHNNDHN